MVLRKCFTKFWNSVNWSIMNPVYFHKSNSFLPHKKWIGLLMRFCFERNWIMHLVLSNHFSGTQNRIFQFSSENRQIRSKHIAHFQRMKCEICLGTAMQITIASAWFVEVYQSYLYILKYPSYYLRPTLFNTFLEIWARNSRVELQISTLDFAGMGCTILILTY